MGNKSDIWYADKMLAEKNAEWLFFAGMVYMTGIMNDIPESVIRSYIVETYHGMDIETEVPKTRETVKKDLLEYYKNL